MTGTIRPLLTAILLLSWTSPSVAINPGQKVRVRELVKEGGELADIGKFAEARDRFMSALELARVPAVALYAAQAHERLRELVKAAQLYRLASEMNLDEALWDHDKRKTQVQLRSREDARVALLQLLERNCTLRIQVVGGTGAEVQVAFDGVGLDGSSVAKEWPVNPGSHVIAIVQGATRLSQVTNVDQAEHRTVTFELTSAPATEPPAGIRFSGAATLPVAQPVSKTAKPTRRTELRSAMPSESTRSTRDYLTWTSWGIGAVGLGTGLVAGLITLEKRSVLLGEGCTPGGSCSRDSQVEPSDLERHNTWRTISTVGLVVGGVGVVAGVTLMLTEPKSERAPRVALRLAPGVIGAAGTF